MGINVDVQRLGSGGAVASAVIGGSIDIGKSSIFGLIAAHAKGIPFVLESVASTYDWKAPTNGFIVAKSGPIASVAQLNGKTVAVPALGDLYSLAIANWVDQNGGNSTTLNYVELPVPLIGAAIGSGRIAGAVIANPFLSDAIQRFDLEIIGHPFDSIGHNFGVTYYFCMESFAQTHADPLARFRNAMVQAARYAQTHRNDMVPILAKYTGMSPDIIETMSYQPVAGLDARQVQPSIDFAARMKTIPKAFPAGDIIDPNIRR
jgi:NitT/TauT family transport system substrate-binding protein